MEYKKQKKNILTSGLLIVFKMTKSIVYLQEEDRVCNICQDYLPQNSLNLPWFLQGNFPQAMPRGLAFAKVSWVVKRMEGAVPCLRSLSWNEAGACWPCPWSFLLLSQQVWEQFDCKALDASLATDVLNWVPGLALTRCQLQTGRVYSSLF